MPSDLSGFIPVVLHLPFFKAQEPCLRFEKKYSLKLFYSVLSLHLWREVILFSLDPKLPGDLIAIASWLYPWLALVTFVPKKTGVSLPWDLPCRGRGDCIFHLLVVRGVQCRRTCIQPGLRLLGSVHLLFKPAYFKQ